MSASLSHQSSWPPTWVFVCSNYLGWFMKGCTPDCIGRANFFWIGQPALLIWAHQSGFCPRPLDFEETVFVSGDLFRPTWKSLMLPKEYFLLWWMDYKPQDRCDWSFVFDSMVFFLRWGWHHFLQLKKDGRLHPSSTDVTLNDSRFCDKITKAINQ